METKEFEKKLFRIPVLPKNHTDTHRNTHKTYACRPDLITADQTLKFLQ